MQYIRCAFLVCIILLASTRLFAVGFTPTDGGLVVDLEQGDRFLLSVMVDDDNNPETPEKEFFVNNYNRYSDGEYHLTPFNYTAGLYLKLIPQAANATEPSEMSIWSIGAPLDRVDVNNVAGGGKNEDYNLGAGDLVYTMWNDGKTLMTTGDTYHFYGNLTSDYNDKYACDVVFVVPTDHAGMTSFDPENTLGRAAEKGKGFNGQMGYNSQFGLYYREVYWLEIPRFNAQVAYSNAALVTFNTGTTRAEWYKGGLKIDPGHAAYAYADKTNDRPHHNTPRTLFRLYLLDDPINSCENYFFATNEQDYKRFRKGPGGREKWAWTDSTDIKKIYTWDHFTCMEQEGSTTIHKTGYMKVPAPDSTYYYVGFNNDYKADGETMGSADAHSAFTKIRDLPLLDLSTLKAPAGACGKMVVNTTSSADNLGVAFEPAGYMLKVSTGTNVPMVKTGDNEWTTRDMWYIDAAYDTLYIKATLMTGSEYSGTDPGADIVGWSTMKKGNTIPVHGASTSPSEKYGYARIYTNNSAANGAMEFFVADLTKHVHYDNNGFLGMEIPDQYPLSGSSTVRIEEPRLKTGYIFDGWSTHRNGGDTIQPGTTYTILSAADTLYALAHYDGTLQVAISFIGEDGKRYYLTHPGSGGIQYARARHFEDWENTWQGMENAENLDPNYLSTYEMRWPINEMKYKEHDTISPLSPREKVLDPRRYTMHGFVDSLTFYEHFAPARDEYIGLYYTDPNVILANNTWAGLFTTNSNATSTGWPDYQTPSIDSVKLRSTRYVYEADPVNHRDELTLATRGNNDDGTYVKYNTDFDQFDAVTTEGAATYFQISAVIPADARYIIVPDTTNGWQDTIIFDGHQNEQIREEVWTSLIGKQLMAAMMVGGDTTYFHPNLKKEISDPNNLYLSPYFRVSQMYEFIPDSRVTTVVEGDRVTYEATDYHWHNTIVSGLNSPMNVTDGEGNYIDIIDTFRITLSHGNVSQIKEYRGRWNAKNPKVTASRDGSSRTRNLIIRTKTYHYGPTQDRLVLKPEKEIYSFGPLVGQSQQINFILTRERYRNLLDAQGTVIREDILVIDTLTSKLALLPDYCNLKEGHSFEVDRPETTGSHATLNVIDENTSGANYDTLIVSKFQLESTTYEADVRVPLVQAALEGDELIWSVMHNGQRYFIMAGKGSPDHFIFRQYTQRSNTLYKRNSSTALIMGSKDKENSDEGYITPWRFTYINKAGQQLTLKIGLTASDTLRFNIASGTTPAVGDSTSTLTYVYTDVYANTNANYEEQVKLKYGANKWLKFNGTALVLVDKEEDASVFSWAYPQLEYSMYNNGAYPSQESVTFGYNTTVSASIVTRINVHREYSMLLDNKQTYLCRKSETNTSRMIDSENEWKMTYVVSLVRDVRPFDGGAKSSGLNKTPADPAFTSVITPSGTSPTNVSIGGNYVDIVDTLQVAVGLQAGAPTYRFTGNGFKSISEANVKIPLIRKTYHTEEYDSLFCSVANHDGDVFFPTTITPGTNDTILYILSTTRKQGTQIQDVAGNLIAETSTTFSDVTHDMKDRSDEDSIVGMHLENKALAEVRLMDEYGNTPDWCEIKMKSNDSIVIRCTESGVRSPRSAYLYFAYILTIRNERTSINEMRFVSYRLTVSQDSRFSKSALQTLEHSNGASGDEMTDQGTQQVHENKRILYYYPDQDVELPIRERAFYGWWRWYREGKDVNGVDVSDSDIPDSLWRMAPLNTGGNYTYPFRTIIVDSVWVDEENHTKGKKLGRTMGRYTVFHYKSGKSYTKADPPAKNPRVAPPVTEVGLATKPTLTYVADISNYYDNLPLSLSQKNQVDTALLDTTDVIKEPTLSLREIFELRPWTEMAERMENYKTHTTVNDEYPLADESYMEDHVVMAPLHTRLLLQTEQRYNLKNITTKGHSESLLGYYMRDDHWSDGGWDEARKDTMIWCGGWDADCLWYTYDPETKEYTKCNFTVTADDDFLQVEAKNNIDTVYYCLRARSKSTTRPAGEDVTVDGSYWFNICRYKVCYHYPNIYGPKEETKSKKETRALITNDEIEQRYEVLERLNFDYLQPGSGYQVYPHPLPWADASYGYTYPETSDLPHNRYHNESNFPNHGEYGLINRIPYSTYWYQMEQHGGAANGYMIYCDGMSSAGQVAALSLETHLCAGQKMFFSAYVGNPSSQTGKSNPNFIFSVQGRAYNADSKVWREWEDVTSYMTGDIQPSDKWYQIYFPINHIKEGETAYEQFRVRIYNVSSNWDGNDFIIDDMCIFATKPPLIAYQANTACQEEGDEKDTHVILRVDYQGITGDGYNGKKVFYTVKQVTPSNDTSFVEMLDHYMDEDATHKGAESKPDTIFGKLYIPLKTFESQHEDSVFANINQLLDRFEDTYKANKLDGTTPIFREGYIYEVLEGEPRPVKYTVHSAKMDSKNTYTVHMSGTYGELLNSICGMTSYLKVSNRMVLELNGMEEPLTEVVGLCANETYDISLRVKGELYLDSVAPIDLDGSCINDWLLYGDTIDDDEHSKKRYGYYYSDIKKVITEGLRIEPSSGTNKNQFAPSLSAIDKNELRYFFNDIKGLKQAGLDPYAMLDSLVTKGFLTLYKSKLTATVTTGDSVQYVIFPIVGTGTDALNNANIEVCPAPIFVKLKAKNEGGLPLMVGGLHRDSTQKTQPVEVLVNERMANSSFKLRVDSIMENVGIQSIMLQSTNDPNFLEGIHSLSLVPEIGYPLEDLTLYYKKGDSILLAPAPGSYYMRQGYNYTFHITMQDNLGRDTLPGGCAVGTIPFILSVQPDYLRWEPKAAHSDQWNNPDNWIAINHLNVPIHKDAHFAPMASTCVLIPQMTGGMPYPVVPPLPSVWKDSVQKVNFEYNNCNVIRFLPGGAMGQQQRMRYTNAVIDMPLPQKKWAFRAAPVKGMLSGDIYMSNDDLDGVTTPWEVAEFDAAGRSYKTGNGSFWLSVFSRTTIHRVEDPDETETRDAVGAAWSKVTNGLSLSLPPASGYAVYARTASSLDAAVRLPKNDDKYYYYDNYGEKLYNHYEPDLRNTRDEKAGGSGMAGKLAFHSDYEDYTISNDNSQATTSFVFGNPTMGYIDIWGFIDDNCLVEEIGYLDESGVASVYNTVTRATAENLSVSPDMITNQQRYLPPMHAIMVWKTGDAATSLSVTLNAYRIVTDPSQVSPSVRCGSRGGAPGFAQAPQRYEASRGQGIMTVTATNPASSRCVSHLLLGQGYHAEVRSGEDALLTTLNIDNFNTTSTPTTPFNIYALEDRNALSIDLRDEIVSIPVSFYMSDLEYEPVTYLWFTGVNNIDGELVFFDAQTNTERPIIDGICITIETPTQNHERRYYIRRRGFNPQAEDDDPVFTGFDTYEPDEDQAVKFIKEDHVYILRHGQVYTLFGQRVQ